MLGSLSLLFQNSGFRFFKVYVAMITNFYSGVKLFKKSKAKRGYAIFQFHGRLQCVHHCSLKHLHNHCSSRRVFFCVTCSQQVITYLREHMYFAGILKFPKKFSYAERGGLDGETRIVK